MTTRAGRHGSVPGSRASFVLRRTRFAPLVPACLLMAVLTSVTVTTALASFGARALPAAEDKARATRRARRMAPEQSKSHAPNPAHGPGVKQEPRAEPGAWPRCYSESG